MDELHVAGRELRLVNVVIGTPAFDASSNWPPVTPETVNWSAGFAVSASVAARSPAPSTTVWPSEIVRELAVMIGASSTFVNVIVAASGPVVSAPSKTETL